MRTLISALAVLVALTGTSFGQPAGGGDPTAGMPQSIPPDVTAQVPTGPSADVLIKSILVKTVKGKVVVEKAIGSGVYLGKGIVITDMHVVDGAKEIVITLDRDGVAAENLKAVVAATSKANDVAVLHVVDNLPAGMQEAHFACRAPVIGEQIEVVGNPLGVTFVHTWGRVAGVPRSDKHQDGISDTLAPIDVSIASGNSGGPVYDKDGKVLGLADAMLSADRTGGGAGHVSFMTPVITFCKEAPPTS